MRTQIDTINFIYVKRISLVFLSEHFVLGGRAFGWLMGYDDANSGYFLQGFDTFILLLFYCMPADGKIDGVAAKIKYPEFGVLHPTFNFNLNESTIANWRSPPLL